MASSEAAWGIESSNLQQAHGMTDCKYNTQLLRKFRAVVVSIRVGTAPVERKWV